MAEADIPFDLVPDALVVQGVDGRISRWNDGATRLYGWDAAQATGGQIDTLLSSSHPLGLPVIDASLRRDGQWEGEVYRTTSGGRDLCVRVRRSLRADGAMVEWSRDVAEATPEEIAAHRYRNLFHAMAASFWELDFAEVRRSIGGLVAAGTPDVVGYLRHETGFIDRAISLVRVVDVNEKTLSVFGIPSREAALSGGIAGAWPTQSRHVFAESLIAALQQRDSYGTETILSRMDGSTFDALFTVCWPRDHKARGTVLVGVIDISDLRRTEAQLSQARAEFSHAARVSTLGELAASIAHEVRQPLAAITTFGQASLRWLQRPEPDVAEATALIDEIVADARRASDIIGRIRDMAYKCIPEAGPVDVNDAVSEALAIVRHEGLGRGVTIRAALSADLPAVLADRVQVQQVVVNLAVNAMQAMDMPGRAERVLTVETALGEGSVTVTMRDTGPGIAPDILDRVFSGFFTTKKQGMGMGLSICRTILQAHGGTINAGNHEDGAWFTFVLPVVGRAEVAA